MTKKVEDLDIPDPAKKVIMNDGITELYPPQAKCVDDILKGENCVMAYPTASGKTLIAYLSIINNVMKNGGKALYIVPLKALASEKIKELKEFEKLGISSVLSMGNYDNVDPSLKEHDVIVATSEKADSLLRHNVDWIYELDTIIADEVHLVNDETRGATLEVTLSKLKNANPDAQIVALSATINNSKDIAKWLDAKHYKSNWRPVELKKGVNYESKIVYDNGKSKKIDYKNSVSSLSMPIIKKNKQCLVFVNSRRSTCKVARDMKKEVRNTLSEKEGIQLKELAEKIHSHAKTSVGEELALCVRNGTAFHHAGLNSKQRKWVEDAFRNRLIKCDILTHQT